MRPLAAGGVHVHARNARTRIVLAEHPLHLLRAQPSLAQPRSPAARAGDVQRFRMLAVVTHEPLGRAVMREADAAVGTDGHVAAGAALHERRVAASVQQEDTLLAPGEPVAQRHIEWLADGHRERGIGVGRVRGLRLRLVSAQIHHVHVWQPRTAGAIGQREQLVLARRRIAPALQAGRGTAQHHDGALRARAHDGDFARVIAWCLALLVAALVLLVHDDGAQVAERCEDGRSRTHRDALFTATQREPCVISLAVRQRAVEHGNAVAEHGAKAIHRLRSKRDFRHEDDGRLPLVDHHAPQQFQVHQCLATARDAMQQRDMTGRGDRESVDRDALRPGGSVRVRRAARAREERIALHRLVVERHQLARHQALQHRR